MANEQPGYNGWNENAKMVLKELEKNDKQHMDIKDSLDRLTVKLAILETKMTVKAGLTGALTALVVALATYFITKGGS